MGVRWDEGGAGRAHPPLSLRARVALGVAASAAVIGLAVLGDGQPDAPEVSRDPMSSPVEVPDRGR